MRTPVILAALTTGLLIVPAAHAGPPVFGAPTTLAADGTDPSVAIGLGGDAVVAWAGRTSGVFVARRGALGGRFSAPERISDDKARAVRVTRNLAGSLAVVWVGGADPSQPAELRAAVAPPRRPFGPPETVPLPATGSGTGHPDDIVEPASAIGADGSVTVAVPDVQHRLLVAVRPTGGGFEAAQVLGERAIGDVSLGADGLGSVVAAWTAEPPPDDSGAFRTLVYAAERRAGTGFGPPWVLSDPARGASDGTSGPAVAANARGDVVVAWPAYADGYRWATLPSTIDVAERTPAGEWSAPHAGASGGGFFGSALTAALNDRGDGVIAEYAPTGSAESVFRPAHGAFGARQTVALAPGAAGRSAVGIDALGQTVHLNLAGGLGTGPADRILAVVRAGAGPASTVPVSTPKETESAPDLAFDPFGNGLVVWSSPEAGGGAIRAAVYSAGPPVVRNLRVLAGASSASRPASRRRST